MGGGGSKDGGAASVLPAGVRDALAASFHSMRDGSNVVPVERLQVRILL